MEKILLSFETEAVNLLAMRDFVAADDLPRPPMENLCVEYDKAAQRLVLVATNGHIMAVHKVLCPDVQVAFDVQDALAARLIPLRQFDVILFEALRAHKDGYCVLVEIGEQHVRMSLRERGLTLTRPLSPALTEFPAWKAVIPEEADFAPSPYIAFDMEYTAAIARAARRMGIYKVIPILRTSKKGDGGAGPCFGVIEIQIEPWPDFRAYLMPCRVFNSAPPPAVQGVEAGKGC